MEGCKPKSIRGRQLNKTTTIYNKGYEVEIDIVPDIGTPAVDDVFDKVNRKLALGRSVSLSDIQDMLGVKGSRKSDGYCLDPNIMRDSEMDYDWQYLIDYDPYLGKTVYGRKVIIWGLVNQKRKTPSNVHRNKRRTYESDDNFRFDETAL